MSRYESHLAGQESRLYEQRTVEEDLTGAVADLKVQCEIWLEECDPRKASLLAPLIDEVLAKWDRATELGVAA